MFSGIRLTSYAFAFIYKVLLWRGDRAPGRKKLNMSSGTTTPFLGFYYKEFKYGTRASGENAFEATISTLRCTGLWRYQSSPAMSPITGSCEKVNVPISVIAQCAPAQCAGRSDSALHFCETERGYDGLFALFPPLSLMSANLWTL